MTQTDREERDKGTPVEREREKERTGFSAN